jgi:hypothetical protein
MFKIGGGGSTAKPHTRIKAASKKSAKKELIKRRQKQKLRENNL